MGQGVPEELSNWSLPELLDAARALTAELAGRLADPMLVEHLPQFPATDKLHPADEWGLYADVVEDISFEEALAQTPVEVLPPRGTFPEIHAHVEELGRVVDSARAALAGHTDRLFDECTSRKEILGIPAGKSAYRNAVEYLREHSRISRRQAKARIERSRHVLVTPNLDRTQTVPPRLPMLSHAASEADLDPTAVDIIAATLLAAQAESAGAQMAPADVEKLLAEGEQSLVSSARVLDPDALGKVCAHWRVRFDALVNADGAEPADSQRRVAQGLFYRGRRTGLHRWSLVATDGQHEVLKTIVSAASNLRAHVSTSSGPSRFGPPDAAGASYAADPADTAAPPTQRIRPGSPTPPSKAKDVRVILRSMWRRNSKGTGRPVASMISTASRGPAPSQTRVSRGRKWLTPPSRQRPEQPQSGRRLSQPRRRGRPRGGMRRSLTQMTWTNGPGTSRNWTG